MVHTKIEISPKIMFGKPIILGTRITVEQILRKLAGGMTIEEIIGDQPNLTRADILAAAAYAADVLAEEEIVFANERRI